MAEIIVWNMHKNLPFNANTFSIRIDRKSPVGNPYEMHGEEMRNRVCDLYEKYFYEKMAVGGKFADYINDIVAAAKNPQYKIVYLLCWCAPRRCHGDTIKQYVLNKTGGTIMKEIYGAAWDMWSQGEYDGLCVTSNGYVNAQGRCVMGRGIALEAKTKIKDLDKVLGNMIKADGNHVHEIYNKDGRRLFSFPTKHVWNQASDINLIKQSCTELMAWLDKTGVKKCLLPRPGCGNGKLKWADVKPVIAPLLDDRVCIITWEQDQVSVPAARPRVTEVVKKADDTVTVCFTGHRPNKLGGYDWSNPTNQRIIARLKQIVSRLMAKYEKLHFICGGALGVDQMAFEMVHALKREGVTLELAVPFKEQPSQWPKESIDVYERQLRKADIVTEVDKLPEYTTSGVDIGKYSAAKMQRRNEYMVDKADVVIAVFDGTSGGTANCVAYAKEQHKVITFVHPMTLAVTLEGSLPANTRKEVK